MEPKQNTFFSMLFVFSCILIGCSTDCGIDAPISEGTPSVIDSGSVIRILGMAISRAAHTATLVRDGKVLIAGGFGGGESAHASAELYNPASRSFELTGSMTVARQSHSATRLPDGKVLIVGGYDQESIPTAELYDPEAGGFVATGSLTTARYGHSAILLKNGKVLIVGGVGTNWTFLDSAELYDPQSGTFSPAGRMTKLRVAHTATLLRNGLVLISGGSNGRHSAITIHQSAELYDPTTNRFTVTGNLNTRRHKHDAALLPDGRVLVIGGSDERDDQGEYTSAEIYNPATGSFTVAGNMYAARYKFQNTSLVLKSGKVLIMGGSSLTEIYDPVTNIFSGATRSVGTKRLFSASALLQSGEALFTGGYGTSVTSSTDAWLFIPR